MNQHCLVKMRKLTKTKEKWKPDYLPITFLLAYMNVRLSIEKMWFSMLSRLLIGITEVLFGLLRFLKPKWMVYMIQVLHKHIITTYSFSCKILVHCSIMSNLITLKELTACILCIFSPINMNEETLEYRPCEWIFHSLNLFVYSSRIVIKSLWKSFTFCILDLYIIIHR